MSSDFLASDGLSSSSGFRASLVLDATHHIAESKAFSGSLEFANSSDLAGSDSFGVSGDFTPVPPESGIRTAVIVGLAIGTVVLVVAVVAVLIAVKLRWPQSSDDVDLPTDAGTFQRSRLDVPLLADRGADTFGLEPDES
jgi:hypothetical protein